MSSDSESDEEYVPGAPEQLSEEDSADDETDIQYENEQEQKANKRQSTGKQNKKPPKLKKTREATPEEEPKADPEAEKKREDDLWAMFLDGTDTKPKATENVTKETTRSIIETKKQPEKETKNNDEAREKRIFEFAGEKIVVENNVITEKIPKSKESSAEAQKPETGPSFKARGSGGLSSLVGQLNKKNKLSTLEKSKLDWDTYKKVEGVEEEVQTINKGKNGYLERQDFLQRTDMRQYEIERDLRTSRRSHR